MKIPNALLLENILITGHNICKRFSQCCFRQFLNERAKEWPYLIFLCQFQQKPMISEQESLDNFPWQDGWTVGLCNDTNLNTWLLLHERHHHTVLFKSNEIIQPFLKRNWNLCATCYRLPTKFREDNVSTGVCPMSFLEGRESLVPCSFRDRVFLVPYPFLG